MKADIESLSQIWIEKYKSNDERDIDELILEMESEDNGKLQPLLSESVLSE